VNSRCVQRPRYLGLGIAALALWLPAARLAMAQQTVGATFGDVIHLTGGTPSDIVLDELRHQLYLVNNTTSQVIVFDYNTNTVTATIAVGKTPLAAAMSMDGSWLYVTCSGNTSLNVVDLSSNRVVNSVLLPSAPQGVEVGNDGRVLVAMNGTGVVAGVPQGTLAIYDRTLTSGQSVLPVTVPALPTTPAPLPAPNTNGRPQTTFLSKLMRTPDGQFIVGVIAPSNAATYVFVYEVASGIVLRNRTIAGQSTVLSMAPDGSRFMAGFTLFDMATLSVIAQENNANAPFPFASAFNTVQNVGGSVFAPDGSTLYAAFNTAPTTFPAPPSISSTLLVNDPTNLGIRLGIKLPESIVAKIVMKSSGSDAWGLSDSGLIHLPIGNLFNSPILSPQTTDVFLAMDDCNHGIATGTLGINNLGKGKLSYSVAPSTNSAALVYQQSSGLAPSAVTFTMEPGRSGVVRQAGTNIWTGAGTFQGTQYNMVLTSAEAINQPNTVRVYMNYRQPDQRGLIFPVPTTPNSSNTGTTNANGNEGLQDILLDEARGRVYITNSGYNRIEVFDTRAQKFLNPISVGQLPHQMAMSTDGTTLYVGNTGGESISIVDLNLQQVIGNVVFPPFPRNGTTAIIYPRSLAMGLFGLQFVMSNGTQWQVVGNNALPRPVSTVIPTTLATSNGPSYGMVASPGYDRILTMSGNGNAYVYDATSDQYVAARLLFPTIQGYYGVLGALPGGNYLLADGLILNQSLGAVGGAATPSASGPITPSRNVAAVAPIDANSYLRLTTSIRSSITATTSDDSRTTLEMVNIPNGTDSLVGVVPENPVFSVFGTNRFNANPRMMVVDSAATTAYAITFSGLSVIPLATATASTRPVINSGTNAIVNSSDGTPNIQPGSFITISGQNLAGVATASTVPPPTVLGGSCVTFGDIAVPLLQTSSGKIQAQVPDTLLPGTQVVEVRSLAMAQDSDPVTVTVRPSTSSTKPNSDLPTPEIRKRGQ
jgi:YVTN family beta-propeller protein